MQIFIAALIGALVQAAGSLVGRVLLSLGFGYMVFTGVDTSIAWARDFVVSRIAASHAQTVAAAGALKVGTCISILTSALTARLMLNGLTGGTLKRMVSK
jgi:hypothetical protein